MIENAALESILETADDVSLVCELYSADATPTDEGFDPTVAIGCFAAVSGITFKDRDYSALVKKFGRIKRTITSEINNATVTFSNLDRAVSRFEFLYGFEGLILVIRLLSRSQSVALTDTQILFAGRCEKPTSGSKDELSVMAKFIIGSIDVRVPRRKFGPDDNEGRHPSDPEFEGFIRMPEYSTVTLPRVQKRGGFLGWWNRKVVMVTEQYSNWSDYDANKSVPEVFGKVQMLGVLIGGDDQGVYLRIRLAWCEGPIYAISAVGTGSGYTRSVDLNFPLHPGHEAHLLGLVGTANGPDDPLWVATGYYSRTAHSRLQADNSSVDSNDAPPDIAGVIQGRLLTTPNAVTGNWTDTAWSDNAAAVTRFLLTDEGYYRLDSNWIDDEYFLEAYNYNAELIFNTSVDDFIFIGEG